MLTGKPWHLQPTTHRVYSVSGCANSLRDEKRMQLCHQHSCLTVQQIKKKNPQNMNDELSRATENSVLESPYQNTWLLILMFH